LAFFAENNYNMDMRQISSKFWLVFLFFILFPAVFLYGQDEPQYARRFQNGVQLYNLSHFREAAIEFRRAQEISQNNNDRAAALYWVILSQMAYADFGSAISDMEELERIAPNSTYARDIIYHRARVYHMRGFFEDALFLFNRYNSLTSDADRESQDRRAASFFWMGECLFSMNQFDEAQKFYAWVVGRYPESPKVEAASYRLDLIKQKKIEAELLALLQWSHEEALRTSEEHQRTIRTFEHTLNFYQRRLGELSGANQNDEQRVSETLPENYQPITSEDFRIIDNSLLERAIQLENEVREILRAHGDGGIW
jgi:tetratricopeptide (TPR) repeat protein